MSEWRECQLGDLTTKITKGTTPPNGKGFVDKGINYIKSDAISYDGRIDKSKFAQIDKETHQKFKRSQIEENDILFSMAGVFLGKSALVPKDILPANTNQALAIIRLNQKIAYPQYVSFFLRQSQVIDFVNNMSGQSAQPNINFQEISSIEIKLPLLPEQRAIASVLSSLDDKIDLLHRQNTTLEKMAETLFRQWFVERKGLNCDFDDLYDEDDLSEDNQGNQNNKCSDNVEEVKEEWKEGTLADIAVFYNGKSRPKDDGKIPIYGGNGILGYTNISNYSGKSIIIGRVGAYCGSLYYENRDIWVSDNALLVKAKQITHTHYLFYLLKTLDLNSMAEGSSHPLLTQALLKSISITLPPLIKIEEFDFLMGQWSKKITSNNTQIRTLTSLRDTLLPKLMSGEVRVRMSEL